MTRAIPLAEYRKLLPAQGRLCIATLRKRIQDGQLRGGYQDAYGRYWVDLDKNQATIPPNDAALDELCQDEDVAAEVKKTNESQIQKI